jgi:hypothetical protein
VTLGARRPRSQQLRALAATGALLVLAGAGVGWFELTSASAVRPTADVVRPGQVLGLGVAGWLVLAPLVVAPALPASRRAALAGLAASAPGLAFVALAEAVRPRTAVSGETIDQVVADRTLGQALSLVGALLVVMALGATWRAAPDWRLPATWSRGTVTEP